MFTINDIHPKIIISPQTIFDIILLYLEKNEYRFEYRQFQSRGCYICKKIFHIKFEMTNSNSTGFQA